MKNLQLSQNLSDITIKKDDQDEDMKDNSIDMKLKTLYDEQEFSPRKKFKKIGSTVLFICSNVRSIKRIISEKYKAQIQSFKKNIMRSYVPDYIDFKKFKKISLHEQFGDKLDRKEQLLSEYDIMDHGRVKRRRQFIIYLLNLNFTYSCHCSLCGENTKFQLKYKTLNWVVKRVSPMKGLMKLNFFKNVFNKMKASPGSFLGTNQQNAKLSNPDLLYIKKKQSLQKGKVKQLVVGAMQNAQKLSSQRSMSDYSEDEENPGEMPTGFSISGARTPNKRKDSLFHLVSNAIQLIKPDLQEKEKIESMKQIDANQSKQKSLGQKKTLFNLLKQKNKNSISILQYLNKSMEQQVKSSRKIELDDEKEEQQFEEKSNKVFLRSNFLQRARKSEIFNHKTFQQQENSKGDYQIKIRFFDESADNKEQLEIIQDKLPKKAQNQSSFQSPKGSNIQNQLQQSVSQTKKFKYIRKKDSEKIPALYSEEQLMKLSPKNRLFTTKINRNRVFNSLSSFNLKQQKSRQNHMINQSINLNRNVSCSNNSIKEQQINSIYTSISCRLKQKSQQDFPNQFMTNRTSMDNTFYQGSSWSLFKQQQIEQQNKQFSYSESSFKNLRFKKQRKLKKIKLD